MELLSEEEFAKLSLEDKQAYLISAISSLPEAEQEQMLRLIAEIVNDGNP